MGGFTISSLTTRARILKRIVTQKAQKRFDPLPAPRALTSSDTVACQPALYEPDQIERVLSCGFKSTLSIEVNKLNATSFPERPLTEYPLGPSTIAGGWIFTRSGTHFFGPSSPLKALRTPLSHIDARKLINTEQGLKYFGHWLRDDCTLYEYLREGSDLLSMRIPNWPDSTLYQAAFDQHWQGHDFAQVENLTIYRELGFNRDKARRLRVLRTKLRAAHPNYSGGQIVYISRGSLGVARDMSNKDTFEEAMRSAGIRVVDPGSDPQALLGALLDAKLIITIEGSQAAHGVYMLADRGAMLILQPPERFYNPHAEWARLLGNPYGIVVGTKDDQSFHINPDEVLRMADRLMTARGQHDA